MQKVTVSAPGKLMLLGEHAVVYGQPCIVTTVGQRMHVTVERTDTPSLVLDAKDVQIREYRKPLSSLGRGNIPKGARFIEVAVRNFIHAHPIKGGIKVVTASDFASTVGFGSSSASVVCVIKALSELSGANLSDAKIFELSYKTVLDVQKKGSGFDLASAIFGHTLWFTKAGKVIEPLPLSANAPAAAGEGGLPLLIGYSGVKADTVTLMQQVSQLAKAKPELVNGIYKKIGALLPGAKKALLAADWQTFGQCMNDNQELLSGLGVSTPKLDAMIVAAREAGAYGAKLSGAGGGDCMIAIVSQAKRAAVAAAITKVSGQVIDIPVNVAGVTIEA